MRRWLKATICLGLFVHLGCGGGSPSSDSPTTEMVRGYVERLNSGDIDAAMSLRCEAARIASARRPQFDDEVARLKRNAGGALTIASNDRVATPTLVALTGELGEDEVSFRLRLGDGESKAIHITTVTENGVPKLCGMAVQESFAVRDQLAARSVMATPTHIGNLQNVANDASVNLGITTIDDSSTTGRSDSTATEGWTTAWNSGDFGGGRISLYRYANIDAALAAAESSIDKLSADAVSTFSVPSAPAAIGLRYLGSAWTWAQPADLGPQLDTAIVVYDDVVITMATSGLGPQDDHSKLISVVDAVTAQITG